MSAAPTNCVSYSLVQDKTWACMKQVPFFGEGGGLSHTLWCVAVCRIVTGRALTSLAAEHAQVLGVDA